MEKDRIVGCDALTYTLAPTHLRAERYPLVEISAHCSLPSLMVNSDSIQCMYTHLLHQGQWDPSRICISCASFRHNHLTESSGNLQFTVHLNKDLEMLSILSIAETSFASSL
jgi:hypothetical protein